MYQVQHGDGHGEDAEQDVGDGEVHDQNVPCVFQQLQLQIDEIEHMY